MVRRSKVADYGAELAFLESPSMTNLVTEFQAIAHEEAERKELEVNRETLEKLWKPESDPQLQAFDHPADELLFGGAAGGGKSALLLILATLSHKRSIIFRREYPRLKDLIEKSRKLLGGIGRYNSNDKIWRGIPGGRTLEFGAVQHEDDKESWRGIEHDLKAFDELTEFSKEQYEFLITWNRSSDPNVRCRVVATCNPPSNESGQWIKKHWAAWLDPRHPNPALPGELRWYAVIDGEEVEVPSGEPIYHKDEVIQPRSRSFIPARLEDNAYLKNSSYKAILQRLPEPLRSQLLKGDFQVEVHQDHPWQVIFSEWVDQAMARWRTQPNRPQSHLGVDVARGGCFDNQTEILTNEGWKLFDHLTGKEQILTLDGNLAKWGNITKLHKYRFTGYLNVYDGEKINFAITDNHNLIVRTNPKSSRYKIEMFENLPENFIMKGMNTWEGQNPDHIEFTSSVEMPNGGLRTKKWKFKIHDWAKLLGWFVSEGCVYRELRKNGRLRVTIAQKHGTENLERLELLLQKMGIKYRKSLENNRARGIEFSNNQIGLHLMEHCYSRGFGAEFKQIPKYIKEATPSVIEAFLETYCLGDGTENFRGSKQYSSTSKRLIDDVQECLIKLCKAGKIAHQNRKNSVFYVDGREVHRRNDTYTINQKLKSSDIYVSKKKIDKVFYDDYVYCVSTPLKTIMVRRKGCVMWSGNSCESIIAPRHGNWVGELIALPGQSTPNGDTLAEQIIIAKKSPYTQINIDVVGVGSSAYDSLIRQEVENVYALNGGGTAEDNKDITGTLEFFNLRSMWFWHLRELLDPKNKFNIALPPDQQLKADLITPRWSIAPSRNQFGQIRVESKDDIIKRLGRSPDRGDAVMYAFAKFDTVSSGYDWIRGI